MDNSGPQPFSVFVHIVFFNSLAGHGAACLECCLRAVLSQQGFEPGKNLWLKLRDNASKDGVIDWIKKTFPEAVYALGRNEDNLGYAAAHNQGLHDFMSSGADYFLALNPDVALEPNALIELSDALRRHPQAGTACPKLYRADAELKIAQPKRYDAAGMYLTPALRHFDRGSEENESGQYEESCYVFGGSGACLLMRRDFIQNAALDAGESETDLGRVYPALLAGRAERVLLFDEAFFAYREDADLAWRALLLGWKCVYAATAVGYHKRVVLPEKRAELPADLNLYSVRNRFLMQLNNFSFSNSARGFWPGVIIRNLLVIAGIILYEWSSLPALVHVFKLRRRALARRREIKRRTKIDPTEMNAWLDIRPHTEAL